MLRLASTPRLTTTGAAVSAIARVTTVTGTCPPQQICIPPVTVVTSTGLTTFTTTYAVELSIADLPPAIALVITVVAGVMGVIATLIHKSSTKASVATATLALIILIFLARTALSQDHLTLGPIADAFSALLLGIHVIAALLTRGLR